MKHIKDINEALKGQDSIRKSYDIKPKDVGYCTVTLRNSLQKMATSDWRIEIATSGTAVMSLEQLQYICETLWPKIKKDAEANKKHTVSQIIKND